MFTSESPLNKLKNEKIKQLHLDQKNGGISILNTMIDEWKNSDEDVIDNLEKISSQSDLLTAFIENEAMLLSFKLASSELKDPSAIQLNQEGNVKEELNALLSKISKHMYQHNMTTISGSDIIELFGEKNPLAFYLINNTSFIELDSTKKDAFHFSHEIFRDYFTVKAMADEIVARPKK